MSKEHIDNKDTYYTVIEGTLRTKVSPNSEGAVAREYTNPQTKETGVKYERVVNALSGTIQDMWIKDGEYGKTINIKLDENEEGQAPIIQFNISTNYGEDFLRKLPAIDLDKPVLLRPYAFEDDRGKDRRGVAVTQEDEEGHFTVKVFDFFVKKEGDSYVSLHGIPEPENIEKGDKDAWKIHFLNVRMFLVNYAVQNILTKYQKAGDKPAEEVDYPQEDIDPDDIPF